MRVWMQARKAEVMKRKISPSNTDAEARVASTAFLSWHLRSTFQVLRGAKHESCSYFWLKSTSELWDCWCSLLATQSRKKICPSQCSIYTERLLKETSFIDTPAVNDWASYLVPDERKCQALPVLCLWGWTATSVCAAQQKLSFKSLIQKWAMLSEATSYLSSTLPLLETKNQIWQWI